MALDWNRKSDLFAVCICILNRWDIGKYPDAVHVIDLILQSLLESKSLINVCAFQPRTMTAYIGHRQVLFDPSNALELI